MTRKKGFIQTDYVVAFGFFFIIVVFITQYVTGYLATVADSSEILLTRSEAVELLSSGDFPMEPLNWTNESDVRRIGFSTTAYRMLVMINNTSPFFLNQSQELADITSELVIINYTRLGFDIDINSTVVYDENNNSLSYQISTTNITIALPVNASQVRYVTLYFDDDSNFTSRSVSVSGTDNLTEKIFFPEKLDVLQFRQVQKVMNANYTLLKNATQIGKDFAITILDVDNNTNFMSFGAAMPRRGNVVAFQRYMLYQNSSGFVRKGRLTVQVG